RLGGDQRGPFLLREPEPHGLLVAGERDVDDPAHPELHLVADEVLLGPGQRQRDPADVVGGDHGGTVPPGYDNYAGSRQVTSPPAKNTGASSMTRGAPAPVRTDQPPLITSAYRSNSSAPGGSASRCRSFQSTQNATYPSSSR